MTPEQELDDKECLVTFEQTKAALEAIEAKLAERFSLTGDVRAQLFLMDRENRLIEDDVVADWHDKMSSYIDWLRYSHAHQELLGVFLKTIPFETKVLPYQSDSDPRIQHFIWILNVPHGRMCEIEDASIESAFRIYIDSLPFILGIANQEKTSTLKETWGSSCI